jgi:hypothetical protein
LSAQSITVSPDQVAELQDLVSAVERNGEAQREEIRRQQGINTILYAALRETAGHIAVAQRDLMKTGRGQDPEVLDQLLEEIVERVSAAYGAAGIALYAAEMRVDLDGRTDVIVLAEASVRLRAAGRRP